MSAGKQTPRQKMIGMMYLVLTALLALNVQKEVLNAFVIVDEGLTKMNENYSDKNKDLYGEFDRAVAENPKKAKQWRDIALKVRDMSNNIFDMIQDLKIQIVKGSEGEKTLAVTGKEIHPMLIGSKETTDKPAEIMIVKGNGKKLRNAIESYRNFLLDNIDPKAEIVRNAIKSGLNTNDPPAKGGKTETWESEQFEQLPLIGVTTIMTGLQSNVRNAESDMLRYLYSMIDKGTFKFTNLEATVIYNSNYVIKGTNYQAKIFLAAFDTTQNPTIFLGPYDSTLNDDGTYAYKKKTGYNNYDTTTPVIKGKGLYTRLANTVGNYKWGGLIKLKAPGGGEDIWKPFREEYQVVEPLLVVSPTKMNVFYVGVDNPVEISVPGVPADKVVANISNGIIKPVGKKGSYIVNPVRAGQNAEVSVLAKIDKVNRPMGSKIFRVRIVPDPVAKVAGIKGSGGIDRAVLLAQAGVVAEMENFEFDLTFKVIEFTVSTVVGGFTTDKYVKSNKFSTEQMNLIKQASRGQKVYIEGIRAVGPDGSTRQLGSIALIIK